MTTASSSIQTSPRSPIEDLAQIVLSTLRKELDAKTRIYNAVTGELVLDDFHNDQDEAFLPSATEVWRHVAHGNVNVELLQPGKYRFALVAGQGHPSPVLAAGIHQGFARNADDATRECAQLSNWLHCIHDRFRLTEQLAQQRVQVEDHQIQSKVVWEGMLGIDHALRRVRIHRDVGKTIPRILETVYELLNVQTLAFVPPDKGNKVILHGEPIITQEDCWKLSRLITKAPDFREDHPIIASDLANQPWAAGFNFRSLLALPVAEQAPTGWILALNKGLKGNRQKPRHGNDPSFRKSDAVLLMPFAALARLNLNSSTRFQELKDLVVGLARSLTSAIDAKDTYTYGHSERVARVGVELGKTLGLEGDELNDIYLAGLLHDVGKIGVPDAVLQKKGALTAEEFEQIKQHVRIGYTILCELQPIQHLLTGVLYHHERMDGKGYPDGLTGDKIPRLARILAVADAYDAMSTNRPYRDSLPQEVVERRLLEGSGTQWDPVVIDAFMKTRLKIHAIRQRGVGESLRIALDGALRIRARDD